MLLPTSLLRVATRTSYCRQLFAKTRRPALVTSSTVPRRSLATSVVMSKEQMEELQKNEFYNKYADKIAKLQKTSPEEFLARINAVEENKKSGGSHKEKDFSLPGQPKPANTGPLQAKEKRLDDVIKVDLLSDKTDEEIGQLWSEHYRTKDAVSAVIPAKTYQLMKQRFEEFNTFLFPLPRDKGYEFVMVQFAGNEAHFTTLINFQAYKENAPECLSMIHYPDLAESKGVVLMCGEYDKNVLTAHEAQCLANQVEMYYCRPNPDQLEILRNFTRQPTLFHHKVLIDQLENLSLDTSQASVN